jgi:hypothetical protein
MEVGVSLRLWVSRQEVGFLIVVGRLVDSSSLAQCPLAITRHCRSLLFVLLRVDLERNSFTFVT